MRYIFIFFLWVQSHQGFGQKTIIIPITEDAVIFSEPDSNGLAKTDGKGMKMAVGRTGASNGNSLRRILIGAYFSDSIPEGANILSAALHLTLVNAANRPTAELRLHRLLKGWGEGFPPAPISNGSGRTAVPGEVTWEESFKDSVAWDSPGGDFISQASSSLTVNRTFETKVWKGLETDVQSMLDEPSSNFGWILIGDEENNSSVRLFSSREDTTGNPMLVIEYSDDANSIATPRVFDLRLFPNPSTGDIFFSLETESKHGLEFKVLDSKGMIHYQYRSDQAKNLFQHKLSTHTWPKGIYFLVATLGDKSLRTLPFLLH